MHWNEPFSGRCNRAELWDLESLRRQDSKKSVGGRSLEGSSTRGRLGLEGFLFYFIFIFIRVLQLYSLVDRFQLGGLQKGFLPSSSISSSITYLGVILCLHLSSHLFKLSFYC